MLYLCPMKTTINNVLDFGMLTVLLSTRIF